MSEREMNEMAKLKDILGRLEHRATEQPGVPWRLPIHTSHIHKARKIIADRIDELSKNIIEGEATDVTDEVKAIEPPK